MTPRISSNVSGLRALRSSATRSSRRSSGCIPADGNAGVIRLRNGTVVAVTASRPGAVELAVRVARGPGEVTAIAYPALVGDVAPGDEVLLNGVALELGLGTGGADVVVAVLRDQDLPASSEGRIVKMRYSPHQVNVDAVEDVASEHRDAMEGADSLDGTPVVWTPLHSMVGPVAAGARAAGAQRVAYVMTDGAALPAGLSRL